MKNTHSLLGIILLITLLTTACSRGPQTKAKLNFSLGYEVVIATNKARVFGVMNGKTTAERTYNITVGSNAEYSFPNGTYTFYTVEWNGSSDYSGAMRCGVSPQVDLKGGGIAVDIAAGKNAVGNDYCGLPFFKTLFDNYCYEPESSDNGFFRAGTGTVTDPYIICNIDQLNRISANFAMTPITLASYKLARDINFHAKFTNIAEPLPFSPIGNSLLSNAVSSTVFSGTFDGNGKSIYGMTITASGTMEQLGFIRNLSGTIKNINFYVPEIDSSSSSGTAQNQIAIVAGKTTGTAILNNVHVYYGRARGSSQVGGLVGNASSLQIVDSSFRKGEVAGKELVGGLVGEIQSASGNNILRSFSSGKVRNEGDNSSSIGGFGGLVGRITSVSGTAHIDRSFSTMDLTGMNTVGGLVGIIASSGVQIVDSYSTGNVSSFGGTASATMAVGGIVGNNNASGTLLRVFHTQGGVGMSYTASITNVGAIIGLGSTTVCQNSFATENTTQPIRCSGSGSSPLTYDQMRNIASFTATGSWSISTDGTTGTSTWVMDDNGYDFPRLRWETPRVCHGQMSSTPFAGGSGTAASPYLICDTPQFNHIQTYSNSSFKLLRDIDLISSSSATTSYFPLSFTGALDGDYNTINNLSISASGTNTNIGLFNHVAGTISSLNFNTVNIVGGLGSNKVGAVAGSNTGLITKVHVKTGSISGDQNVGAVVGSNQGTISLSSGEIPVEGHQSVGGLVGENLGGTISQSKTFSFISLPATTPLTRIGGLVGYNKGNLSLTKDALITQSFSYTNVFIPSSLTATSVGGLVGLNENDGSTSAIIGDSFASGQITDNNPSSIFSMNVGGLVGMDLGEIQRCFANTKLMITPALAPDSWGPFAGAITASVSYTDSFVVKNLSYDWDSKTASANTISNSVAGTLNRGTSTGQSGDINVYTTNLGASLAWTMIADDKLASEDPSTVWMLKGDDLPRLIHADNNEDGRNLEFYKNLLGF